MECAEWQNERLDVRLMLMPAEAVTTRGCGGVKMAAVVAFSIEKRTTLRASKIDQGIRYLSTKLTKQNFLRFLKINMR